MKSICDNKRIRFAAFIVVAIIGVILMTVSLTACNQQSESGASASSSAPSSASSTTSLSSVPSSTATSNDESSEFDAASLREDEASSSPDEQSPDAANTLVCIGDSITYGYGLADPSRDAWPSLLQDKLGSDWRVVNLGVIGSTLMDEGWFPYRSTGNVERALELDAAMAIIMLGSNDSADPSWNSDSYHAQLETLVDEITAASSHGVQIVLMSPPCTFFEEDLDGLDGSMSSIIGGEMREAVKQVAADKNALFIDLFAFTEGHPEWFPDCLHPNEAADRAIADYVYEQFSAEIAP